jgi:hypothetical protein
VILIGCVLGQKSAQRAAELKDMVAERRKAGPVETYMVDNFLRASCLAEEKAAEGEVVCIAGSLADLHVPDGLSTEGFGVIEWRESWLARLERSRIGFVPLAVNDSPQIPREALLATNVIRSFTRASKALDTAIREIQSSERKSRTEKKGADTGYVCGRPPYGYRAVEGQLVQDPKQVEAIKIIFKIVRGGGSRSQCLAALKEAKARGYWDVVKVRRILRHSRLYCLGECSFRDKTVTLPDLAFLPEEWVNTVR